MLNLLVAVDRSLEASFALRSACLFGLEVHVRPIYIFDPPGRDISFGAGWARRHWEQETSRQAEENIEDLVLAERNQCPNIEDPVVLTGDPVQEMAEYFWETDFDMLVAGVPFRGWGPRTLSRRFGQTARKAKRDLPLLTVRRPGDLRRVLVLTDGGGSAESALGLLVRLSPYLPPDITLIGLAREGVSSMKTDSLNLERGLAILREKSIDAQGHTASSLGLTGLMAELRASDLVVKPFLQEELHQEAREVLDAEVPAVLFYIGRE